MKHGAPGVTPRSCEQRVLYGRGLAPDSICDLIFLYGFLLQAQVYAQICLPGHVSPIYVLISVATVCELTWQPILAIICVLIYRGVRVLSDALLL